MNKLTRLKNVISRYHSAVIAYSGGVDSTFLAKVAKDVLGENVLLITACSSTYPARERDEARELAISLGIPQEAIVSEETDIEEFCRNSSRRCYYCKKELFGKLMDLAKRKRYEVVFDGSNIDDVRNDYRPGRMAIEELGIVSPLLEAEMCKEDIRKFSREISLPTANKPAYACLASRFPYGEPITKEKLMRVERAEDALHEMGYNQFRIRCHGDCARVEIESGQIEDAWRRRNAITVACKKAGFVFVSLDTQGYRMGAMNEALNQTNP